MNKIKIQLAKIIYVNLVASFSLLVKNRPTKKRLIYLMSFSKNENGFLKSFIQSNPTIEVILLYKNNCRCDADVFKHAGIKTVQIKNTVTNLFYIISLMSTAKVIVCDNYFPIFAGLKLKKDITKIQLWHANGAVKTFGLEDKSIMGRTNSDNQRFKNVYTSFDEYIVGSEMMGKVFKRSYAAKSNQIKNIGYPRSDIYFNNESIENKRKQFFIKYPELKNKQIILYAPTYRNNQKTDYPIDIATLYKHFGDEYALLFRKHPHSEAVLNNKNNKKFENFYFDKLEEFKLEDLLVVTDCLITDYSSVPFDYALLSNAKKIIFYCYDYKIYKENPGIQKDFSEWAPGDIVETMQQLIESIKEKGNIDFNKFNQKWNTYNDGKSTERLVHHIVKKIDYLKT